MERFKITIFDATKCDRAANLPLRRSTGRSGRCLQLAYRAEALHGSSSVEVVVPEHLPLERGAEQRAEQREASLVVGVEGARRALGARGRRLARQLVGERDGADGLARRGEHLVRVGVGVGVGLGSGLGLGLGFGLGLGLGLGLGVAQSTGAQTRLSTM